MTDLTPAWHFEKLDPVDSQGKGLTRVLHRTCCIFYSYTMEDINYCPHCGDPVDDVKFFDGPEYDIFR